MSHPFFYDSLLLAFFAFIEYNSREVYLYVPSQSALSSMRQSVLS